MIVSRFVLIFFLFSTTVLFGQEKRINSLKVDTIYHAGINPAGELFFVSTKGVSKCNQNGSLIQTTAFENLGSITSFDSWHLTEEVIYTRDKQRIDIYTPQLDLRTSFTIDSSFAIEPYLVAASTDEKHFWIFDAADLSLKKVNPKTGEVLTDVIISTNLAAAQEAISMREYQHFLFFRIKGKLLVFNGMGKQLKSIELPTEASFDFFGEEMLVINKNYIQFTNLFSSEKRTLLLPQNFKQVLLTDTRLFGVTQHGIEVFEFLPN